eukprot:3766713-Amphidinium_carterae.1
MAEILRGRSQTIPFQERNGKRSNNEPLEGKFEGMGVFSWTLACQGMPLTPPLPAAAAHPAAGPSIAT